MNFALGETQPVIGPSSVTHCNPSTKVVDGEMGLESDQEYCEKVDILDICQGGITLEKKNKCWQYMFIEYEPFSHHSVTRQYDLPLPSYSDSAKQD